MLSIVAMCLPSQATTHQNDLLRFMGETFIAPWFGHVVGADSSNPIEVSYGKRIGNEPTGADHPEMLKMKLSKWKLTILRGRPIFAVNMRLVQEVAEWSSGRLPIKAETSTWSCGSHQVSPLEATRWKKGDAASATELKIARRNHASEERACASSASVARDRLSFSSPSVRAD